MTAVQDVFVIPDGSAGALAELERRKFTAEEGVSKLYPCMPGLVDLTLVKDHLTLLNGEDFLKGKHCRELR